MRLHARLVIAAVAAASLAAAARAAGPAQGRQAAIDPAALFRAATGRQAPDAGREDLSVIRQRAVTVDLAPVGGAWGALPAADRLRLTLFDDVEFVATRQRIERSRHGAAWIGTVDGVPLSQVVLAVVGGEMTGSITMPGRSFDVQPDGGGLHLAREIDDRLLPEDGEIQADDGAPEPRDAAAAAAAQAAGDDPGFVDVLVAYTTEVKSKRGGDNATLSMVDAAVAAANQAYQNSQVGLRLRLVGTAEVDDPGAGDLGADLSAIRSSSDGRMDEIHGLRDSLGADLVALIVETDPKYCGMAYVITHPSAASAASGFSVIKRTCMTGYSFAHELGHNMGLQHDWYMNAAPGAYRYSHGHVDLDAGFRTVMAYSDMCTDQSRACTRIAYFSNPGVSWGTRPTGVPEGTGTNCTPGNAANPPCDADSARSLRNTAQAVANFRASLFTGKAVEFPPRNETFAFRTALEVRYRDGLRRAAGPSYADVEGSVVWVSEYLLYRIHQCDHDRAMAKVRMQIQGAGLPSICAQPPAGTIPFPPRNETYAMRLELEAIYRDELKRQPSQSAVDVEGDVVWTQEYLRYRLNGCTHDQAASRVMTQIDGGGIPPVCR
ncbi:MAG: zinc-dependent metalloprotease family protein [Vicinamibacterales bacterium]